MRSTQLVHIGAYSTIMEGAAEHIVRPTEPATEHSRMPRVAGRLAGLAAATVLGGVGSLFLSDTSTHIGPVATEVRLNLDEQLTVDFSHQLLDAVDQPEKLHLPDKHAGPIGVTIKPNGIIVPNVHNTSKTALQSASDQLSEVVGDPDNVIATVRSDMLRHAVKSGLFVGGLALAGALLLGPRRRQELSGSLRTRPALSALLASSLLTGASAATNPVAAANLHPIDAIYQDTPLEHAVIEGPALADFLATAGKNGVQFYKNTKHFYDRLEGNLHTTLQARSAIPETWQSIGFFTDLHCNFSMSQPIGMINRAYGVKLVLDAGDDVFSGRLEEKACLQSVRHHNQHVTIVDSFGNHDSDETVKQAKSIGYRVVEGSVIEAGGIRILGDKDPRRSAFGVGLSAGSETISAMNQRLADTACDSQQAVDVLLVHDRQATTETTGRGCVKLALSGHLHQHHEQIEHVGGQEIVNYNGGSIGGSGHGAAAAGQLTIGPLNYQAEYTVFFRDTITGQFMGWDLITMHTDTTTTIERHLLSSASTETSSSSAIKTVH